MKHMIQKNIDTYKKRMRFLFQVWVVWGCVAALFLVITYLGVEGVLVLSPGVKKIIWIIFVVSLLLATGFCTLVSGYYTHGLTKTARTS